MTKPTTQVAPAPSRPASRPFRLWHRSKRGQHARLALASCLLAGASAFAGATAAASPHMGAASLSAYATATTDYRELGLSRSGGDASLEAGLDYQHPSGFFTGLAAASVEYPFEAGRRERRNMEVQIYSGYNWRNASWSATAAVSRYVYPSIHPDYDYNELGAGFGFRERVFLTFSYTDAVLGRGPSLLHTEATFAVPVAGGVELGGTLGRVDSHAFAGNRYTHWDAGASKTVGPVTLDLRFYDNDAQGYRYYGEPLPNRWVFSVSYGFSTR